MSNNAKTEEKQDRETAKTKNIFVPR
jgi:hypothetical protein